ncbi:MAG: DUF5050 domain-containing protein [Gemmatimonadota bacterium]|nr:DUF5050 domain-containing protein [Gemmatimonadota bacterium]
MRTFTPFAIVAIGLLAAQPVTSPDFDGDGVVGFPDFLAFAAVYGTTAADADYVARFDLDSDGEIGFADFLIFAGAFGSQVPPSGGGGSDNPDLVVESASVSDSVLTPGQSFTLSATVRNQGAGGAEASTLRYYRSSDATISTDDTDVGTDAVDALAAGDTSAESISLNAPSDAGTWYYGACVDSVRGESDTGNNCSRAVRVTVTPDPASRVWKLYWTEYGHGTGKIQRSNLDGSDIEDLVTESVISMSLALDVSGGKMYWTALEGRIRRSNLDGSGVEALVTRLVQPIGIALDVDGGKMYWTDRGRHRIQRSNLDGSGIEDLVDLTARRPWGQPLGIALDVDGGKMYWTDNSTDKIQRSNLDGSGVEDLVTTGLAAPFGIALDVAGGRMYWTDASTKQIRRSNLDGSGGEDLVTGMGNPQGIALDGSGAKMYWTDASTKQIRRSNLDGSGVEDLVTRLVQPIGIAVSLVPGDPDPVVESVSVSETTR